ncbi:esterase/lipase family protein [Streptomyces sp. NPDC050560]|uniref:esterase/lipase family protein n=1 Tax=Streptomyces sp. NPDC050560 TaxID=3365630 RepID=UPI0037966A54
METTRILPFLPPLPALSSLAPPGGPLSLLPRLPLSLVARLPRPPLPAWPVLPLPRLAPAAPALPVDLLKSAALELAILTGHLLLYPSGILQERRPRTAAPSGTSAFVRSGGPPVVLLHGFIDNRSVFVLLRHLLAEHGRRHVESFNHSPVTGDVRWAALRLADRIEEIRARTGSPEVDIVGHSLGGLIARYYVQRLGGDDRVRTLVTLGTPHSGTRAVPALTALPIVRQMRPGSDLLDELGEPAPGCRTRFVSFWSTLDEIMDPPESAALDHPDLLTHNVRVTGIGHLALPVHPTVTARVRQVLDEGGVSDAAGGPGSATGGLTVA